MTGLSLVFELSLIHTSEVNITFPLPGEPPFPKVLVTTKRSVSFSRSQILYSSMHRIWKEKSSWDIANRHKNYLRYLRWPLTKLTWHYTKWIQNQNSSPTCIYRTFKTQVWRSRSQSAVPTWCGWFAALTLVLKAQLKRLHSLWASVSDLPVSVA